MTLNLMKECLSVHYYDIFLKLESSFRAFIVAVLLHIHFSSVASVLYGFMYIALLHCLNNCKIYSFLTLLFVWFTLPCFVIIAFKILIMFKTRLLRLIQGVLCRLALQCRSVYVCVRTL